MGSKNNEYTVLSKSREIENKKLSYKGAVNCISILTEYSYNTVSSNLKSMVDIVKAGNITYFYLKDEIKLPTHNTESNKYEYYLKDANGEIIVYNLTRVQAIEFLADYLKLSVSYLRRAYKQFVFVQKFGNSYCWTLKGGV